MQGQVLYRDIGSLASRGVSCDTAQGCALERCDTALAHAALGHDTVVGPATQRVEARGEARKGAGARRARHCAQGRARACCDTAGPGHDTAGPGCDTALGGGARYGHVRAPRRAWCIGWASWGLVPPVWFFDSVVFLSHCLDQVHEHCS